MKQLIVALDMQDKNKAMELVKKLSPWVDVFKVGPILFLQDGPQIIREIKKMGKEVFLDLKFHDIPATVKRSVESAQKLGVYSLTIHSSGGEEMIRAASEVLPRPKLWAVTVLTSKNASSAEVLGASQLAKNSGADGVIASALEIETIKKSCGRDFTVVTPGIRLDDKKDDQKRTATPIEAINKGADFIVVGRPIIEAENPVETAKKICKQIGSC